MATVAELKTKALELERQGHVDKALAIYRHVLKHLEGRRALEAEVPLFVKVGDLELKQGRPDEAIVMYERAAERYVARGVATSVVALCLKILRVDATRTSVYRRFARSLLDAGHVAAARDVLLDYAQRAKRPGAAAALERVAGRPEDEVQSAIERMLTPAGTTVSGPRPAVEAPRETPAGPRRAVSADGVAASGPRPAVSAERPVSGQHAAVARGVGASGPRPGVPATTATGPRPVIDAGVKSGPRRAVNVTEVGVSGPRRAADAGRPVTGPHASVAPRIGAVDPRPSASGPHAAVAPPAGSAPPPAGQRARLSPSREAEALDEDAGPPAIPDEPATFREPFLPRSQPEDGIEDEDDHRAPPAPRVAPPEREPRRAFAGTARHAERGRAKGAWRWVTAALVLLAAGALALGYFGLVPLDVRDLAAHVGLGQGAAADGAVGAAGSGRTLAAPIAVTDTAATAVAPTAQDTADDSAGTSASGAPADTTRPRAVPADTAPAPEAIRPLGPPPPTNLPRLTGADTTTLSAPAVGSRADDSAATSPGATISGAEPVRLPAGVSATGPVVVVPGLAIASFGESPSGHEVVHRLEGGTLVALTATRFGGTSTAAAAPNPVRVTTLPGDTAVGTARVGEFMVSARASLPADALRALLGQLVVVEPAVR